MTLPTARKAKELLEGVEAALGAFEGLLTMPDEQFDRLNKLHDRLGRVAEVCASIDDVVRMAPAVIAKLEAVKAAGLSVEQLLTLAQALSDTGNDNGDD